MTKVCTECGRELPLEMYYKEKNGKYGRSSKCMNCKKQYYGKNKEKILQQRKQYYEEHKEYMLNNMKQYSIENKERVGKYKSKWRKSNLSLYRLYEQRRKAKQKQLPSTLTEEQWDKIKEYFNNRCCYCNRELTLTQEHFIPLSKGGEYTHNNIIPACQSCNSSKHDTLFHEWYPKYRHYSKKREKKILDFLGYKDEKQQLSIVI